jgi:osmoprotectant transport system ATP-binding protein
MIRLDDVTKQYPGQPEPAVDHITLDIPGGEIVIFVGPSGCGKTTTMKLINRLIEPSAGRIFLGGEDITRANPDHLRRRIGYVIQQVGLFPHMTIAENIGLVPRMLNWDSRRIAARVDELLGLVGLDPAGYRDRYPRQLSGGQQQRVGVARALAADPPVMLMDEPFGATDPITRERLQNEFLRIQAEVKKTIVFVTHDIDEAIKMGDRILILREHSRIAQYAPPDEILRSPAGSFVEDFIGAGASLKRLHLARVRDVALEPGVTARLDADPAAVRDLLGRTAGPAVLLLDEQRRPQRWVGARDLERVDRPLAEAGRPVQAIVQTVATLHDALDEMLTSDGAVPVVDGSGVYQGLVTIETVMAAIRSIGQEELVPSQEAPASPGAERAPGAEVSTWTR